MKTLRRIWAVFVARNMEFLRDRSALAWNFMFPLLVVFGFAFAFSGNHQNIFKVAVLGDASGAPGAKAFLSTEHVQFIAVPEIEAALVKLKHHQIDMVLSLGEPAEYWVNSTSPKGYLLERILWGSDESGRAFIQKRTVEGGEIRYVDWLISGLLGMNMMFSALFGVGYVIVRYRKNGVLKRLKATPLRAFEFLTAQVLSRLILILLVSIIVFVGAHAVVHFTMLGSYLNLLLVTALGAMCLISLGLLVAARISSEELAGGVLNLLTWPMMFLSGVWFSLEGANPFIQKIAAIFPLTHMIDAMRAIMTEGAGLSEISGHLTVLAVATVTFLAIGSLSFKWE